MSTLKPMLAHTIKDTSKIAYPVMVSVKMDGIRCLIKDGVALSRTLKPIRNEYVQHIIGKPEYNGLDGELIVGSVFAKDCYRVTNSGVMSKEGEPDFTYYTFDYWDRPEIGFADRFPMLWDSYRVRRTFHTRAHCEAELLSIEESLLSRGAEGVMVRSPDGPYKYGRSTEKEGILGKLKRFVDNEYEVVDFIERMHNGNEATVNSLGHTERSSHKENKTGRGDLGAIVCRTVEGLQFNVGTGFDDNLRREIWNNRAQYLGRMAKVKHFEIGVKDAPRFPVFLGFRDLTDC